ncbi:hypothetical protein D3C87_1575880 [compost metagenome]
MLAALGVLALLEHRLVDGERRLEGSAREAIVGELQAGVVLLQAGQLRQEACERGVGRIEAALGALEQHQLLLGAGVPEALGGDGLEVRARGAHVPQAALGVAQQKATVLAVLAAPRPKLTLQGLPGDLEGLVAKQGLESGPVGGGGRGEGSGSRHGNGQTDSDGERQPAAEGRAISQVGALF